MHNNLWTQFYLLKPANHFAGFQSLLMTTLCWWILKLWKQWPMVLALAVIRQLVCPDRGAMTLWNKQACPNKHICHLWLRNTHPIPWQMGCTIKGHQEIWQVCICPVFLGAWTPPMYAQIGLGV